MGSSSQTVRARREASVVVREEGGKDPFELVEDIGDLTFEHVKGHLCVSEVSGEDVEEKVQAVKQCGNLRNEKNGNKGVFPEQPDQCENLENKEIVWRLEKEAADAVARAAAAVSDLVADCLPVEETILMIAKASESVLALAESVGAESEEAEKVRRRIESLKSHFFSFSNSKDGWTHPGKKRRQPGKEELRRRQEEHLNLRRSLV